MSDEIAIDEKSVAMRCRRCGYDLRGINSRQCPECGRAFHPNDPATFLTHPLRGVRVLGTALLGLGLLLLPFLLAEFGSPWLLALPIVGACVALIAFWNARSELALRHPWVVNRPALWIGCGIAVTTILLCLGIMLVARAIDSAY